MTESQIKFKLETGTSSVEKKYIRYPSEDIEEEIYNPEYVKWLEERADINVSAINVLKALVKNVEGYWSAPANWFYESATKVIKNFKSIA